MVVISILILILFNGNNNGNGFNDIQQKPIQAETDLRAAP